MQSFINERMMKEEGLLGEFVASLIDERTFANGLFDTYFTAMQMMNDEEC